MLDRFIEKGKGIAKKAAAAIAAEVLTNTDKNKPAIEVKPIKNEPTTDDIGGKVPANIAAIIEAFPNLEIQEPTVEKQEPKTPIVIKLAAALQEIPVKSPIHTVKPKNEDSSHRVARISAKILERSAKRANEALSALPEDNTNHYKTYGASGVDQSTIDAFKGLNLDPRNMSRLDYNKLNEFLEGHELALSDLDKLMVVKRKKLDHAAGLKAMHGPQPVWYTKRATGPTKQHISSQIQNETTSRWAGHQEPEIEKPKSLFSKATSWLGKLFS